MTLSATTLSSEIVSQFNSKFGAPADPTFLQKFADAVAAAVVTRIKADAVVTVAAGIAVTTTGSATNQAGTTTSPGTGSIS
jgi:hypothetical protein